MCKSSNVHLDTPKQPIIRASAPLVCEADCAPISQFSEADGDVCRTRRRRRPNEFRVRVVVPTEVSSWVRTGHTAYHRGEGGAASKAQERASQGRASGHDRRRAEALGRCPRAPACPGTQCLLTKSSRTCISCVTCNCRVCPAALPC